MGERYRGRQRMISEAIFNSPDFMGMTTFDVLMYVGMVIYANDDGVVCAEVDWLRNRLLSGTLRSPKDARKRLIGYLTEGLRRKILLPSPPPAGAYEGHKYVQINNWERHNRTKPPGREDKIRERARAGARGRTRGTNSVPRAPAKWKKPEAPKDPVTPEEISVDVQRLVDRMRSGSNGGLES